MSSYIDIKFINLLSTRLPKFKRKSEYLFNFKCPHCGDSQKSLTKARGFVYKKKNDMFFKCHNCGMGQSLGNLIKFLILIYIKNMSLKDLKMANLLQQINQNLILHYLKY